MHDHQNTHSMLVVHTTEEAWTILRISRSKLYQLFESGELVSFKIGSRRLIEGSAIADYISRQSQEATPVQAHDHGVSLDGLGHGRGGARATVAGKVA
jgi:excisionase family DNA binding protein